jgi:hypothetical protein
MRYPVPDGLLIELVAAPGAAAYAFIGQLTMGSTMHFQRRWPITRIELYRQPE